MGGASCKGICIRYAAPSYGYGGIQVQPELGIRICSVCGIRLKLEGVRCPCCKRITRAKARNYRIGKQ